MVALYRDVASRGFAVIRIGGELAGLHFFQPVRASDFVLEQLLTIEPVLDGVAVGHDQSRVPLVGGLHDTGRRRIERVVGASRSQPALAVGMAGVVEQLVLRRAPVDVVVLLGAAIENAGIATRTQLPVQRELKVSELVLGDDVLDGTGFRQYTVDDMPARRHCRTLVSAPGSGTGSVEERAPPRRALVSGQTSGHRSCRAALGGRAVSHWRAFGV